MFGKKKNADAKYRAFDRAEWEPILKCSICNGEQVAAFRNRTTGEVEEVAFIRSEGELREFMDAYGLTEIEKVY